MIELIIGITGIIVTIAVSLIIHLLQLKKTKEEIKKEIRVGTWELRWNLFTHEKKISIIRPIITKKYRNKEIKLKNLIDVLSNTTNEEYNIYNTNVFDFLSEAYVSYIDEYIVNGTSRYWGFWGINSFCDENYREIHDKWIDCCNDDPQAKEIMIEEANDIICIKKEIMKKISS